MWPTDLYPISGTTGLESADYFAHGWVLEVYRVLFPYERAAVQFAAMALVSLVLLGTLQGRGSDAITTSRRSPVISTCIGSLVARRHRTRQCGLFHRRLESRDVFGVIFVTIGAAVVPASAAIGFVALGQSIVSRLGQDRLWLGVLIGSLVFGLAGFRFRRRSSSPRSRRCSEWVLSSVSCSDRVDRPTPTNAPSRPRTRSDGPDTLSDDSDTLTIRDGRRPDPSLLSHATYFPGTCFRLTVSRRYGLTGNPLALESLSTRHWIAIGLAVVTAVVHLVLGVGFLPHWMGSVPLRDGRLSPRYHVGTRRLPPPTGVPPRVAFTGGQVILWYALNRPDGLGAISAAEGVDKLAQLLLIAALIVLYRRE